MHACSCRADKQPPDHALGWPLTAKGPLTDVFVRVPEGHDSADPILGVLIPFWELPNRMLAPVSLILVFIGFILNNLCWFYENKLMELSIFLCVLE